MKRERIPVKWPSLITCLTLLCVSLSTSGQALRIGYIRRVLSSGMTVVVHESPDIPRVAIDVAFHVGSSSEADNEHGLAHLCEHLYFDRRDDRKGFISSMEDLGATDIDGATNSDYTEFFETVPAKALEAALVLEKKRMYGHLPESSFEKQVEIVEQELGHNADDQEHYALAQIEHNAYPPNHPYSHFPLGTPSSVSSLSLGQADQWMRRFFVPCNATLTIVGDVTPEMAMQYASRLFATPSCIPSGTRNSAWSSPRYGDRTIDIISPNGAPRLLMEWNIPGYRAPTLQHLKLAADIIRARFSVRPDSKRKKDSKQTGSLFSEVDGGELGSMLTFAISGADADQQTADKQRVLAIITSLAKHGPTARELQSAKATFRLETFRNLDSFESLARQMTLGQVLMGSPDALTKSYEAALSCTGVQLRAAVGAWLTTGLLSVDVHPNEKSIAIGLPFQYGLRHSRTSSRSTSSLANVATSTSASGANIVFLPRSDTPLVSIAFIFHTGFAVEPPRQRGVTSLAVRDITQDVSRRLWTMALPASVNSTVLPDISIISVETINSDYDKAAKIVLSAISSEHVSDQHLMALEGAQLRQAGQERLKLPQAAESLIPLLLFKRGSSCRTSWTGNGSESDIRHITSSELNGEFATLALSGLTVAVVGDIDRSKLAAPLEVDAERIDLDARPSRRPARIPALCSVVKGDNRQDLSMIYSPRLSNTMIAAGLALPGLDDRRFGALRLWSDALGGGLYSSLNRVLREERGWSYGVRTFVIPSRKVSLMLIVAYIRNNEVVPALMEIEGELASAARGRVTASDLAAARRDEYGRMIDRYATTGALQTELDTDIQAGLPFSSFENREAALSSISESRVSTALTGSLNMKQVKWLVISGSPRTLKNVQAAQLFVVHSSTAKR